MTTPRPQRLEIVAAADPAAPEHPDRAMITVRGLRKTFALGADSFVAIDALDLSVAEGKFISLVGPSGCGKSTLLNIVAGLERRTGGDVRVAGRDVAGPSRNIGMMFQTPVLLPWRTSLDNVLLPIEAFRLDRRQYVGQATALLRLVGLGDFIHRYPFELSGGMQQRVAICRMLLYDPAVLLMDEPFSALDEMTREFLNFELLRIWQERRKTVLFVTHNIGEAVLLSDYVVVMAARPGRIARVVPIALPRPRGKETLVDPAFFAHVAEIRSVLG